ncbi:MAG TPA: PadR family transcriptional regulator [Acidimicrobiales bacterium]|nr:PadR family transcriptional regulator [Acidimicrobiales bacterium]
MLELAILGLLKEQELHGYELKKRLADTVGSGAAVSFGSLYPALGRLEKAGAVRIVLPSPGSEYLALTGALTGELAAMRSAKPVVRGGRGKKVYAITERGQRVFEELLTADAGSNEDERSFNLRLAFARHLSRDDRIGMLERRRAYLLERLARTRGSIRHGWGRLDAYTRSLMEHGNETTEHDISWLDRLIARERADAGPAGDSGTATNARADVVTDADGGAGARRASRPEEVPAGVAAGDAGATPIALTPWAASAPPTMPVRPGASPPASSPSHPLGGNIQ